MGVGGSAGLGGLGGGGTSGSGGDALLTTVSDSDTQVRLLNTL